MPGGIQVVVQLAFYGKVLSQQGLEALAEAGFPVDNGRIEPLKQGRI